MRAQQRNGGAGAEGAPIGVVVPLSHSPIAAAEQPDVLSQGAQPSHVVQFYDDDDFLCDSVAHFIAVGLRNGEPVCVVATPEHRQAFATRLTREGLDVDDARKRGQLVWLDAAETLSKFCVGDKPDWTLFSTLLGRVFDGLRRTPGTCVRTYGEMVDVLWRQGSRQAALELEAMWNELATQHSIALLCAYIMGNFYRSTDAEPFRSVCHSHSAVLPAASESRLSASDTHRREISELQQRALSLETEIQRRRELEDALREALVREKEARVEAERNARYNEMFAGMLGHDLRNPLSAITTGALYIARLNSSPKASKAATRIVASAERMSRMIDQLLDFTRIRVGGGLALNSARMNLEELCCRVRDELEAANPERRVLVEAEGDVFGTWDHDRLSQVFSNLLGNALSHGRDSEAVTIRCDGRAPDAVLVSVHNHGPVTPHLLPVLFEPFRGNTKYQRTHGLGLGLFITRQIVHAHGGEIDVVSNEGTGTTFQIRLPRSAPRAENTPTTAIP